MDKLNKFRQEKRGLFSGMNMMLVLRVMALQAIATAIMIGIFYIVSRFELLPITTWSLWLVAYCLLGCGMVVGMIMIAIFSKYIMQPFTDLNRATERVSRGDFDVEVKVPALVGGELRDFINGFNKMVRELRSIEQMRSEFTAVISREFKTPLSSMQGYATLLQDEDLPLQERQEYAQIIIDSSRRLSELANNILKLTKLENQQIISDASTFSLDEQLRLVILTMEPQWSKKNIEMDIDLVPSMISSSEELLWQVWSNLLDNAIKFTPEGGTICVQMSRGSDATLVCIKDNGEGMDEKTQEHIFDKFYQGDKTRASKGNGLGLALVKRVLDLCGADISVKSAPGQGAEFTVTFPEIPVRSN